MYKRIISFFLLAVLIASMFSFTAFAADHQHTFGEVEDSVDLSGATMPNGESLPLGLSITKSPCSTPGVDCDQVRYSWDFFGRKGAFVDNKNLPVAQVILHWYKWNEEFYGKNVGFDKMDSTNAGANIPAAGGRNPKGFGDEGKANVNQSGAEILWAEPFGVSNWPSTGFYNSPPDNLCAGSSSSGPSFSSTSISFISPVYYFIAPVTGLYYVGSGGSPYDFGSFNYFYNKKWNRIDYITSYTEPYVSSRTLNKGDKCYFINSWHQNLSNGCAFKFYLNKIPIFIDPLGDSGFTNLNNITINNNTWNGNIYTDNSTNLTYIYPQYTTINEKNETVTNISNTPIIYNNETKQYYTYDQTTKNYYYITYNAPSPSPTPAPTDKPGGSISTPETGKPGGDTGDTTGLLAVLVEIRDNMIQGFLDIKAAFVAGFAELSANFTLAIENLNVNIQNVFNKKFPDQNTPETALPSPTPLPSPAPVEPILPANRFRIIPNMTSNTLSDSHGTWSAFGSSEYSSLYTYFRAFTVDSSYWWTSSQSKKSGSYDREMPCWLAIEIPDPENYYIDGYVLKGAGSGIYYDDWKFQYSDDGSAWTDLDSVSDGGLKDQKEHDFNVAVHKAHKYYRWYFTKAPVSWPGLGTANLYGYNAKDVVTPTPSPSPAPTDPPSPSPAPDPGKPDSGDKTNNFWTIIFPNGGGSEDGKKGIFWALVSLILALIAFFANLAVGVGYLFPFLPDGVVMTINTCLIVIFLFTIIKFIMRSK